MKDLISSIKIRELVDKEVLKEANPGYAKPNQLNYNKMAVGLVTNLMDLFFNKVVDKIMNSNRVILPKRLGDLNTHELYITSVQESHEKFLNSHTEGKVYNAIITGFPVPITIKLSAKRRQELKERLENGQPFY